MRRHHGTKCRSIHFYTCRLLPQWTPCVIQCTIQYSIHGCWVHKVCSIRIDGQDKVRKMNVSMIDRGSASVCQNPTTPGMNLQSMAAYALSPFFASIQQHKHASTHFIVLYLFCTPLAFSPFLAMPLILVVVYFQQCIFNSAHSTRKAMTLRPGKRQCPCTWSRCPWVSCSSYCRLLQ